MKTRLPFLKAVLVLIFFLIAEFLSAVFVNPIGVAVTSHRKLSLICVIIAILAFIGYELWRNKTAEGSARVYPAVQEKKDAEERLRTVEERIKELSNNLTTKNRWRWLSNWKLKRLEKERKNLTRKILQLDEHLQSFGGAAVYKLQELLALAGWDVEPGAMERLNGGKAQFQVEETGNFQKRRRLLVHYLPREAGSADIHELEQAINAQQVDHGWLIAEKLYPGSKIEPGNHIKFFKREELYFTELFNLRPYFEWLKQKGAELNVSKYNVAMEGNIPTYDHEGNEASSVHVSSIDKQVTEWLDTDGLNNIVLLGDFGTGKTWFCWQYANKVLTEYEKRPQLNRIPILMHLGEFKASLKQKQEPGTFGTPQQLIRIFCEKYGIDLKNFELFHTLNKQGRFLMILDGLDEAVSDPSELAAICKNLGQFAGGKSKVLLTSRRTLFKTSEERQALFGLHNYFEVIWLDKFDTDRVKDFIKARVYRWQAYWQKISSMRNLMDLASRPIMLEMILGAFKSGVSLGENSTIVDLYRGYTDFWLEKVARNRSRPDEPQLRRLIQLLAWRMFEKNCRPVQDEPNKTDKVPEVSEITYPELRSLVSKSSGLTSSTDEPANGNNTELETLAKDLAEAEAQTSASEQEVLTRSFLLRNSRGDYFFAHKSFLEYFVAQKLFSDMREGHKEGFEKCFLSPEIVDFLVGLKPNPTTMLSWIEQSRGDQSHLHGNLLTLLNKTGTNLKGQDFSRLYLKGADLSGADLENCNFTGSTLIRVNVRDCRLTNTDFTGASFKSLILGVRSPAKGVAFSSNGKFIASGGGNNAVILLHKDGEKWVSEERLGHKGSITNVAFSSDDDRFLASSSFDQTAIVWKLNSEKHVSLPRHKSTVYDVEFTPDGDYLFTTSKEEIKLWRIDARDSKQLIASELSTYTEHSDEIYKLAVSADGNYLASASFDTTLAIWKIQQSPNGISLELQGRCEGHQSLVNGVSFSPDARFVASASNDGTIRLWSTDDLREVKVFQQHAGIVWDVAYSHSGSHLVSGSLDKMVKVWDLRTEEVVTLEGHSKNIWSVCFSPNDELVVSGSLDSTVRIWDWKKNRCLQTLDMGQSAQQTFNCTGMKFTSNTGLSPFQEIFLTEFGATMLSDRSPDSRG